MHMNECGMKLGALVVWIRVIGFNVAFPHMHFQDSMACRSVVSAYLMIVQPVSHARDAWLSVWTDGSTRVHHYAPLTATGLPISGISGLCMIDWYASNM